MTVETCAVSLSTVERMCRESEILINREKELDIRSSNNHKFRSPGKSYSRKKPVTELDDFDNELIRKIVHSFYDEGEFPTSAKILAALREKTNYLGSKSSVKIILKSSILNLRNVMTIANV